MDSTKSLSPTKVNRSRVKASTIKHSQTNVVTMSQPDLISQFFRKNRDTAKDFFRKDSRLQYTAQSPIVKSSANQMYSITKGPRFTNSKPR